MSDKLKKFYNSLTEAMGRDAVTDDCQIVRQYAHDCSFAQPREPALVVWPKSTAHVQLVVREALDGGIPLVPVSSKGGGRQS